MWEIEYTNRFKRSFKRCIKRGLNVEVFATAVEILRQTGTLPPEYRPQQAIRQIYRLSDMPFAT